MNFPTGVIRSSPCIVIRFLSSSFAIKLNGETKEYVESLEEAESIVASMKEQYSKTAFVDSDWCRSINPFTLTDITKKTVIANLYCLLRNYLLCEEINTVIFTYSWHGERKEIYDRLICRLRDEGIRFEEKKKMFLTML